MQNWQQATIRSALMHGETLLVLIVRVHRSASKLGNRLIHTHVRKSDKICLRTCTVRCYGGRYPRWPHQRGVFDQQYQSSPRSRNFLRCERTYPKETLPTPWTGLFSVRSNLYFESLSMLNARLMHAAANGNVKDVRKLLLKGALFTKDQVMQRLLFLTEGVACGRD